LEKECWASFPPSQVHFCTLLVNGAWPSKWSKSYLFWYSRRAGKVRNITLKGYPDLRARVVCSWGCYQTYQSRIVPVGHVSNCYFGDLGSYSGLFRPLPSLLLKVPVLVHYHPPTTLGLTTRFLTSFGILYSMFCQQGFHHSTLNGSHQSIRSCQCGAVPSRLRISAADIVAHNKSSVVGVIDTPPTGCRGHRYACARDDSPVLGGCVLRKRPVE
jgi:hypothetical protein